MSSATLLITCPDQRGLVAAVSDFILSRDGNIVQADQAADEVAGTFLQRVEFQMEGLDVGAFRRDFAVVADAFGMSWSLRLANETRRVALLVTKQAHCLYDLLARWKTGELRAEFPLVISNHPDLSSVAEQFGVPYHYLPVSSENREDQEAQIVRLLEENRITLVVLARYMQILSPDLAERYAGRVINIHHSFLPAFPGARPYHRAHARGVKVIGATAHYVTSGLDEGPIILLFLARVGHRDSVDDLIRKGRDLEKIVLARAVRLHVEDRVLVYGNKTVSFE